MSKLTQEQITEREKMLNRQAPLHNRREQDYIDTIRALEAENAQLREALGDIKNATNDPRVSKSQLIKNINYRCRSALEALE